MRNWLLPEYLEAVSYTHLKHVTEDILSVLAGLTAQLAEVEWATEALHALIAQTVASQALKFPKVAMPLRVLITGGAQSPSIDAIMAILGRDETIARLSS